MSQRMYVCPRCENKVRTLYEWKDEEFCGMCQQENIERYEATVNYRFFLLLKLTKDYMERVSDQVFFPDQGWARRFVKFTVYNTQGAIDYVQRYFRRKRRRWRARRLERKVWRADRRQNRAEKKALRKLIKKRRKEELRERAEILKAAR